MLKLPKTEHISLLHDESVLYLGLNRPQLRNAMSMLMLKEIKDAFAAVEDSAIRAVVLRGAGGNFCAGGDLKDMDMVLKDSAENDPNPIAKFSEAAGHLFHTVNNAPQAVIAVLEGAVMGGGLGLASVADIAIASTTARFGLPETSRGLIPAQIAPFIRRKVGESYARLLAVLGGHFDAAFAQRVGFVHYLAENDTQLEDILTQVLSNIEACAPQALKRSKQLMFAMPEPEGNDPEHLGQLFAQVMLSDEAREGVTAFVEKRKPNWNTR